MAPLRASTVTVAIWPTFTLPISDSLRGATSSIELRSLSTAKEELEEEEELEELAAPVALAPVAPVRAPVVAAPVVEDPLEELDELDALVVPVPETVSPTWPESVTIVPSWGA